MFPSVTRRLLQFLLLHQGLISSRAQLRVGSSPEPPSLCHSQACFTQLFSSCHWPGVGSVIPASRSGSHDPHGCFSISQSQLNRKQGLVGTIYDNPSPKMKTSVPDMAQPLPSTAWLLRGPPALWGQQNGRALSQSFSRLPAV